MTPKIEVLLITQAPLFSVFLQDRRIADAGIVSLGEAADSTSAWDLIRSLKPKVILFDVETPGFPGLPFIEKLMRVNPLPILLLAPKKLQESSRRMLELGAVDGFVTDHLHTVTGLKELIDKVRQLSLLEFERPNLRVIAQPALSTDVVLPFKRGHHYQKTEPLIIVGASTGGTEAVKEFLLGLPVNAPAVLIAQHMPEMFTKSFAQRLDGLVQVHVKEAEDGERVVAGCAYVAPGHSHMLLTQLSSGAYVIELSQGPPVNRHRPSVDVLFRSAANVAGPNAIGVILTGMGKDGASGLLEMKQTGARTLAQDAESCVVFGMPKEAIALGGADEIVSLSQMALRVMILART